MSEIQERFQPVAASVLVKDYLLQDGNAGALLEVREEMDRKADLRISGIGARYAV